MHMLLLMLFRNSPAVNTHWSLSSELGRLGPARITQARDSADEEASEKCTFNAARRLLDHLVVWHVGTERNSFSLVANFALGSPSSSFTRWQSVPAFSPQTSTYISYTPLVLHLGVRRTGRTREVQATLLSIRASMSPVARGMAK